MNLKPQLEAIIYAAETPISVEQIFSLVKESMAAEAPEIDAAELKSPSGGYRLVGLVQLVRNSPYGQS